MYKLTLLTLVSLAQAASTLYEVQTVTENSTTDVTITSCSGHPSCTVEAVASTETTVTETVNGIETIYTTVCPLSSSTAAVSTPVVPAASSPAAVSPVTPAEAAVVTPVASSSEEITYVDITTTPTVTASTGVEATVEVQSTFTSSYSASNSSAVAGVEAYEGGANKVFIGAAGFAGLALLI